MWDVSARGQLSPPIPGKPKNLLFKVVNDLVSWEQSSASMTTLLRQTKLKKGKPIDVNFSTLKCSCIINIMKNWKDLLKLVIPAALPPTKHCYILYAQFNESIHLAHTLSFLCPAILVWPDSLVQTHRQFLTFSNLSFGPQVIRWFLLECQFFKIITQPVNSEESFSDVLPWNFTPQIYWISSYSMQLQNYCRLRCPYIFTSKTPHETFKGGEQKGAKILTHVSSLWSLLA